MTVSPCLRKTGGLRAPPTPCGVPVRITVPGNSNVLPLRNSISDGTSKTFSLAESREKTAGAWIDGTRNWLTAATGATGSAHYYNASTRTWVSTSGGSSAPTNCALLQNVPTNPQWGGYGSNTYGPSAAHQGGINMHCYVDGHIGPVTQEIDANLYYALTSRGDSEDVPNAP